MLPGIFQVLRHKKRLKKILVVIFLIIVGGVFLSLHTYIPKQSIKMAQPYATVLPSTPTHFRMSNTPANELLVTSKKTVFVAEERPTFKIRIEKTKIGVKPQGLLKKLASVFIAHADETVEIPSMKPRFIRAANDGELPAEIVKVENGEVAIAIADTASYKPGKYTFSVTSGERTITQDFTWGVLAINTDKSVYAPGERVKIGMAVLDDFGRTKCLTAPDVFSQGKVWLTITDPTGKKTELSTENGKITGSEKCYEHSVTNDADFQATFTTSGAGRYQLQMTGENQNEKRSISDYFEVKEDAPFIITRTSLPTRIYPSEDYTHTFTVTAKHVFTGDIIERTPAVYHVTNCGGCKVLGKDMEYDANNLEQRKQLHILVWNVTLQAGETKTFTYTVDPPNVSPEFFLMGPVALVDTHTKQAVFEEARQWQIASDAVRTWDGGGSDGTCGGVAGDGNRWQCAANWSSDTRPGASDVATFDGTSTKDSTVDATFAGSVQGVDINAGYTGTITQSRSLTITTSGFAQDVGTWNSGANNIDINDGSFTLAGGAFTAPSTTLSIERSFTVSSGTFTNNSGTVSFDSSNDPSDDSTLTCTSVTFNAVTLAKSSNVGLAGDVTVGSGCTIPLGNSPSTDALLTNNGTITVGSGTWTHIGSITLNTGSTTTLSSATTLDINDGSFTLSGGTFTAASLTTLKVERNLNNSGNLLPNGLDLTIDGVDNTDDSTLTCGTVSFNSVTLTKTTNVGIMGTVTVGSDCTLPLGNSPSSVALLTNNGTITVGTGTWTHNGTLTINSGSTTTLSGTTTLDINDGSFVLSGGTFIAASLANLKIEYSLTNTANLLPNGLALTFDGTDNTDDSTLTCGNATFSSVTLTKTTNIGLMGTVTISAGCTAPLGNSPTSIALLTNNGTITVGSGTWTHDGTITLNSGSTTTLSGTTAMDVNDGGFTLSGGTFTAASLTSITLERSLTNTANLLPNGLALTFDGNSDFSDDSTLTCGNATFSAITVNKAISFEDMTFGDNCTVTGNFTRTAGKVNNSGSAVTLTVQGNFSMSTTDAFGGANLTVKLSGSGTQTIARNAANTFSSPLVVDKSGGSASLTTAFPVTTAACTVVEGVFDVNGQTFTCGGTFTIEDGGDLRMIGTETPTSPTLNTGSTISYKGDGDGLSDTYTITNYLASYPTNLKIASTDSQDTYQLGTTLDVDGMLTVNSGSTLTTTGTNYDITTAGGITNNGTLTLNSSTVTVDGGGTAVFTGSGTPVITFNNLTSTTPGKRINFAAGKTFRINGAFTITGNAVDPIQIDSDTPESQWSINSQGSSLVSYATVQDSGCAGGTNNVSMVTTTKDMGDNGSCWVFVLSGTRVKGDLRIKGNTRIR